MSGLGGLWACVHECGCGCVWACGCACGQRLAACHSHSPSSIKDPGYPLMVFLPPNLGVSMDNPLSTSASHSLLSSSTPTGLTRPQNCGCSGIIHQTSFLISPRVLAQSLSFPRHLCFDLPSPSWPQAPLLPCQHPLVPLSLSCTNLAKSPTCLNLFPCLPWQPSLRGHRASCWTAALEGGGPSLSRGLRAVQESTPILLGGCLKTAILLPCRCSLPSLPLSIFPLQRENKGTGREHLRSSQVGRKRWSLQMGHFEES